MATRQIRSTDHVDCHRGEPLRLLEIATAAKISSCRRKPASSNGFDSPEVRSLGPGFRRGDESIFNKQLLDGSVPDVDSGIL